QSLGPFPRKRIPPTARFSGGLTPRTPSKSASLLTSPRRAGLVPRPLPSNRSPHPSNWFTHWSLPPAKYSSPTTTTPIPDTLGAGAARQARVLARLSRAPERSRSARSPARWTKCTEAYGPRLWRGSAAGAVNVRGYLSTGAQRPFPLRIGPRGLDEAKTRDRRASWSVKIPAMKTRLIADISAPLQCAQLRCCGTRRSTRDLPRMDILELSGEAFSKGFNGHERTQ